MQPQVAVSISGISKSYGSVQALVGVDTQFVPGEVHAVLGENGAGKSTLMGVLAGFVRPDSGSVSLEPGGPIPLGEPFSIRKLGVSMVHQHFMLVPEFTVAENLALSQLEGLAGLSHVQARSDRALAIGKNLGWEFDSRARVRNLPVGVQQRLEILKALADEARVLILDEPTAVLSEAEVQDLFGVLRKLRDEGRTIILIAHKLDEVLQIADRFTVLRHGRVVATAPRSEVTANQLASWMIGQHSGMGLSRTEPNFHGDIAVRAESLSVLGDRGEAAVSDVSLTIQSGEILGIGGVDGNGQVELAEALAKVRKPKAGQIEAPPATYIPQDRQADGLAMDMSIRDNLWLAGHARRGFAKGPFLRVKALNAWSEEIRSKFGVKAGSLRDPVRSLSGGNQQKIVVGRSLDETPEFVVVVNPTRGLDFNASAFVLEQIRRVAKEGAAVVLFSTDRDELTALADRTLYMSRGRLFESLEEAVSGKSLELKQPGVR